MPGERNRTVRTDDGVVLIPPEDWELLPPGDAALTRRVKKGGAYWQVQVKKGRRIYSQGVWAPKKRVEEARQHLQETRSDPAYRRRLSRARKRRDEKEKAYAVKFHNAVIEFLNFTPRFSGLAAQLAEAVTAHAVPKGSNTVARTRRIPVEDRARAAVIAWMRHNTTAYDTMKIARIRGQRREIRRQLACESSRLLERYRSDKEDPGNKCPLKHALDKISNRTKKGFEN